MKTYTYNGHTYFLTDQYLTWQQAQNVAIGLGGNLVTINDQAEQEWLSTTFAKAPADIKTNADKVVGWIGYTDQDHEGIWKWISGETSTYTNWNIGEPNGGNSENYAQLYEKAWHNGTWNDINISNTPNGLLRGIIEIPNIDAVPPSIGIINPIINTNDTTAVLPFFGITIVDQSPVTATIQLDNAAKGMVSGAGFSSSDGGLTYTFTSYVIAPALQVVLQTLAFQPAVNRVPVGSTETTNLIITVTDVTGNATSVALPQIISTSINNAPTFTTFSAPVAMGNEDSQIVINFADLLAQGNEADVDVGGSVTAFVVKSVTSGHLKIGLSASTATDWNTLSNNTIDVTHHAYWTPDYNANGALNAFTVVAKDNGGLESATPVQATINVAAIPDVNVTAGVNPVEGATTGTFLINLDSPAPVGDLTVNFELLGSALLADGDYTLTAGDHITATTSSSFTIAAGATSAVLNINALKDAVDDPNETVTLNLKTGVGYQLAQSELVSFTAKMDYTTQISSTSMSAGDFNNDGQLDLAVVSIYTDTVSVFLRNPENTDFDRIDYVTGTSPLSVNTGDFNNDGKLDLVTANHNNSVSVLLRNASNTGFENKVDYVAGTIPSSIGVGDFNNDGQSDLAVTDEGSNILSILLRNSSNTGFEDKIDYTTGLYPCSIGVGDFNNDSKQDLVVANWLSSTVSVLFGDTTTGFTSKVDYATGLTPKSVAVGDFNNDGQLDFVTANANSHTVSVFFHNTLEPSFETRIDYATGQLPTSVSAGDFNNDGKLDIAVGNEFDNTVSVFLRNDANTGFEPKIDYAAGVYPRSITVGDFNSDSKPDLAVVNWNYSADSTISILMNNSNPSATLSINQPVINHAPILNKPETINYTDTAFDDCFPAVTETLSAHDLDGDTLTYYVGPADGGISAGQDDGNGTMWMTNAYGTLTVTKATGEYNFVANDAAIEALTTNKNTYFTVVVSDGLEKVSQTLSINFFQKGATESLHTDVLTGTCYDDKFDALAGDDLIYGYAGNDTINGGAGVDTMIGGKGDDVYYVDNVSDVVKESNEHDHHKHHHDDHNGGIDTVYAIISYRLTSNVENLILIGNTSINGFGNELNNYLAGNQANNLLDAKGGDDVLDGKGGADTMKGGKGDDSYYVDERGDKVIEYAHQGEDTVYSTVSYTLVPNVENLVLIGTSAITGLGNALNNHLTGNGAGSTLDGLAGDDNYHVSKAGDFIAESAHNGWDSVLASIDYTLGTNLEGLYLLGNTNLNGNGNKLDNILSGNSGDNILDGGTGDDVMRGRAGNDSYYVDSKGDKVEEYTDEGIDTVYASMFYRLTDNIENLTLTGNAKINGTGNGLDNVLQGNSANNLLRGDNGNDTLIGGNGADTLLGGHGQDHYDLTETTTAATDTVQIAKGDSLVSSYDTITGFHLGSGTVNTTYVDKLDLDSNRIAANVAAVNGIDAGIIHSHSIHNGMITFDDVNNYQNVLTLTAANLTNVFSYLQANIKGNNSVAFVCENNTFVFQDGGSNDTLIELVGVTATNISNTGLVSGAIWLV